MNRLSHAYRADPSTFVLRFQSLFDTGRAYAFPCDAVGHVDMDALSERARNNYLYARTVVGRDVSTPRVQTCAAA
jgi:hypothetical protein